jgi:hypothetical protein
VNIVISQSMYFPWVGLLEQVRLADVFVHYDDVQYTRGFYNRVQVKGARGIEWMTVPLREQHRGQRIDEVRVDNREDWRSRHRAMLARAHRDSPHVAEMLGVVDAVFARDFETLDQVARASLLALAEYFGLDAACRFEDSRELAISGSGTARLHDITRAMSGDVYITGHGARNYLDPDHFRRSGLDVRYMAYRCLAYPQSHGAFTPYVTALDLIANCGQGGRRVIISDSTDWREFVHHAA